MFAVLDVELANNSDKGSICSIGVVLVEEGEIVDSFYSLVKPLTEFHPMCMRVHHIKPEHVQDAPTFLELWPTLWRYLKCGTLVSYRAETDIYALEKALYDANIETPPLRYACAYRMAKKLLQLESYKLSAVSSYFEIQQQSAHNALDDARVTALLVLAYMDLAKASNLNELMRACCLTYDYTTTNNYDPASDTCIAPAYTPVCALPHGDSAFFMNRSVVITGTLSCGSRDAVRMTIEEMGGVCRGKPSKKTNIVVFGFYDMETLLPGCQVGSKLQAAYDLVAAGCDITIIDENELMEILGE